MPHRLIAALFAAASILSAQALPDGVWKRGALHDAAEVTSSGCAGGGRRHAGAECGARAQGCRDAKGRRLCARLPAFTADRPGETAALPGARHLRLVVRSAHECRTACGHLR